MTKLILKSTLSPEIQAKLAEVMGACPEVASEQAASTFDKTSTLPGKETATSPHKAQEDKKKKPVQMKKDWKGRLEKIKAVQAWLQETWPGLFSLKEPKPLKRHIEQEIMAQLEDKFSKIQLRRALSAYTHRMVYLQVVLTAEGRYDLNGNKVEEILDAEKEYSQQALELKAQRFKEKQEKQKKRKAWKLSKKAGVKAVDKVAKIEPSPPED